MKLVLLNDFNILMNLNMVHFTHIAEIANNNKGILIKNSCFDDYNKNKPLLRNLMTLGMNSNKILDIGFNAGHSTLMFLLSNPDCTVDCIDNCENIYTEDCFNYISTIFPNRVRLYKTDSLNMLDYIRNNVYDLVNIDGSFEPRIANIDFFQSYDVTKNNSVIIWNKYNIEHFKNLWSGYVSTNKITEIKLFDTYKQKIGLVNKKKYNIAVLSLAIGDKYKEITKYLQLTKKIYTSHHNYPYHDDEDVYDKDRPHAWSKIKLILKYIRDYDYLVWIDADAYIMNQDIRLEDIIRDTCMDKNICIARDNKLPNTGVIFIKCTDWSKSFFEKVYSKTDFIHADNWEQCAIIDMYDKNEFNTNENMLILNIDQQKIFNSYWYNYDWGDFIIHLLGCYRGDNKTEALNIMENRYCPIKRDNESVFEYLKRLRWLKYEHQEFIRKTLQIN